MLCCYYMSKREQSESGGNFYCLSFHFFFCCYLFRIPHPHWFYLSLRYGARKDGDGGKKDIRMFTEKKKECIYLQDRVREKMFILIVTLNFAFSHIPFAALPCECDLAKFFAHFDLSSFSIECLLHFLTKLSPRPPSSSANISFTTCE